MYPEIKMYGSIALVALILLALFVVGKGMTDDEDLDE